MENATIEILNFGLKGNKKPPPLSICVGGGSSYYGENNSTKYFKNTKTYLSKNKLTSNQTINVYIKNDYSEMMTETDLSMFKKNAIVAHIIVPMIAILLIAFRYKSHNNRKQDYLSRRQDIEQQMNRIRQEINEKQRRV